MREWVANRIWAWGRTWSGVHKEGVICPRCSGRSWLMVTAPAPQGQCPHHSQECSSLGHNCKATQFTRPGQGTSSLMSIRRWEVVITPFNRQAGAAFESAVSHLLFPTWGLLSCWGPPRGHCPAGLHWGCLRQGGITPQIPRSNSGQDSAWWAFGCQMDVGPNPTSTPRWLADLETLT